jgi:hypothetical protein
MENTKKRLLNKIKKKVYSWCGVIVQGYVGFPLTVGLKVTRT